MLPPPILSDQGADPGRQCGHRRENDQQLQQLASDIKAIFSSHHYSFRLRIIILKEVKFQKQKVVNKGHVANLINRKKNCRNVNPLRRPSQIAITPTPIIIRKLMKKVSIRSFWLRRRALYLSV